MNENPKMHRRLEDRLAAAKAGKSLQIVVPGNCRVCKRRAAAVPATRTQVMEWFTNQSTKGFLKYEIRMLTTGVHRDCQKVEDGVKVKAPAKPEQPLNTVQQVIAIAERAHVQKVLNRRRKVA